MRNNNRKILIIALTAIMIFGGSSPMLFATAGDHAPRYPVEPKLHIEEVDPGWVLDGHPEFDVECINTSNNQGVQGAVVVVETLQGVPIASETTDQDGIAHFSFNWAVNANTKYRIWAEDDELEWDGTYGYIWIINRVLYFQQNTLPTNKRMNEQSTWEDVRVIDQNNSGNWLASVWFGGKYQGLTNYWGYEDIRAPDVTAENVLEDPWVPVSLNAYQELPYHYDNAHEVILVKDLDNVSVTLKCDVDFAEGGNPVPDANVCITVGGQGCNSTNQSGKCNFYVFPDTQGGTRYVLWAFYPDYWPCRDSLRVYANPGSSWDFDFNLEEIPWWLQNIVEVDLIDLTENIGLGTFNVELEATPSLGTPDSYSYNWDFGDGDFSQDDQQSVSHEYDGLGRYIITVTAISPTSTTEYGEMHLTIR